VLPLVDGLDQALSQLATRQGNGDSKGSTAELNVRHLIATGAIEDLDGIGQSFIVIDLAQDLHFQAGAIGEDAQILQGAHAATPKAIFRASASFSTPTFSPPPEWSNVIDCELWPRMA